MALIDLQSVLGKTGLGGAAGLTPILDRLSGVLTGCLPPFIRRALVRRDRRLLIEPEGRSARLMMVIGEERSLVGELDLDGQRPVPDRLEVARQPSPKRILMMPSGAVLTRVVSLPGQVRSSLGQVIRYELDRLSPFQASEVLYDFAIRPGPKGAARVHIDLAICRRDLAEPWITRLREHGAPVERIAWEGAWPSANLLPPSERPKPKLDLLSLDKLLWILIVLLLASALIGPLWQQHYRLEQLEAEVRSARSEALAVDDLRQELERARLGSTVVLQQKWDDPNLLVLFRELTDRIPDDTWLQTLDYNNGQVELRGESGQATALIAVLEQAPGIDEVSFRSPVTQVPQTGKERFNISLRFTRVETP